MNTKGFYSDAGRTATLAFLALHLKRGAHCVGQSGTMGVGVFGILRFGLCSFGVDLGYIFHFASDSK